MLEQNISAIYNKLKLYYYRRIFRRLKANPADSLTAIETFCVEAIYGLGHPTLGEFADFINVSQPNAAYKVINLEKKGYVRKIRSPEDGRVTLLEVTEKFHQVYGTSERYIKILAKRIRLHFPEVEAEKLDQMLGIISEELMRELNRYLEHGANLPEGTLVSVVGEDFEDAGGEQSEL